jgi:sugar-specific transcriptional regulator TrmB
MLKKILREMGFPENAALIYSLLIDKGQMSVKDIAKELNIPRPSVYDNLEILVKNQLVVKADTTSKGLYEPDDFENLPKMIKYKIDELQIKERELNKILPEILQKKRKTVEPKIRIFPGADGLKEMMHDLTYYKNTEVLITWPDPRLNKVLGQDFLSHVFLRFIKNQMKIKVLWADDYKIEHVELTHKLLDSGTMEARRFHQMDEIEMSTVVYENKVLYLSYGDNPFGLMVNSFEYARMYKLYFKLMWDISTKDQ